jgi:hypothetical protein
MTEKQLHRHVFCFDEKNRGGEALILKTEFIDNGDNNENSIFVNQELTLHSYCNSATFNLCGTPLTPETLRKLANELESAQIQAKASRTKV